MIVLIVLIACIISAILYRAGGESKDPTAKPKWIPMWLRVSIARDMGCSLVFLGSIMLIFGINSQWWWYLVSFGLSWAALSTYWDFLFGYDNFWFHGLMCGVAGLPLIACGVVWWVLVARVLLCALGMGLISALSDKDYVEEMGRGAFFII